MSRSVILQVLLVMIMCYCRRLSSGQNMDLCGTKDDQRLCTASNSNGFCNPDDFKVENPKNFQATFLDSLAQSNIYDNGKKAGCYRITFDPPVYSYYCCGRHFEDRCPDCFGRAIQRMKDGCASRSGGNVLLDICSLRYELYDICNPTFGG